MKESDGDNEDASVNVTSIGALLSAQQSRHSCLPSRGGSLLGSSRLPLSRSAPISQESRALSLVSRWKLGWNLKLDVIYPIKGFRRRREPRIPFFWQTEFVYPASWVQGQTLFYRAIGKAEYERGGERQRSVNEPSIAFGPPGTRGELNVSVIISTVPLGFSIESFGSPRDIGEATVKTIVGSSWHSDITGSLVDSTVRRGFLQFTLEFKVESASFRRHNIAVCCVNKGKLYTLNTQASESEWQKVKSDFYNIAESFALTA